jgi:alpha-1,3-glucosyltransferase
VNFTNVAKHLYLLLVLYREKVQIPSILSPTPRRHLLESSASNQHWLNSPAISVTSSRPSSPQLTTKNYQPVTSHIRNRSKAHHQSFSSIYEHEPQGAVVDARTSSDKVHEADGAAMGRRWIRWMHKRGIKEWVIPGVIAASTLVKFAIGLGSYSGW